MSQLLNKAVAQVMAIFFVQKEDSTPSGKFGGKFEVQTTSFLGRYREKSTWDKEDLGRVNLLGHLRIFD